MSKSQRKGRLINSRVQRAILFKFIMHWAFSVVAVFGISFTLHLMFKSPEETYSSILGDMKNRYSLTLFVMFALVPYFLRDLIQLTHRVVGPMVRFRDALQQAARGEHVEPLEFRGGDFWQEIANEFNALIKRVENPTERETAQTQADGQSDDLEPVAAEVSELQPEDELVAVS